MIDEIIRRCAVVGGLAACLAGLAPAGAYFADQAQASPLRRRLLLAWLALFDVDPRAEIERELRTIARAIDERPHHRSLARGYAYQLLFRMPDSDRL